MDVRPLARTGGDIRQTEEALRITLGARARIHGVEPAMSASVWLRIAPPPQFGLSQRRLEDICGASAFLTGPPRRTGARTDDGAAELGDV